MAHGYKTPGLEWRAERVWDGVTVDILLFNDSVDDLDDDATLDDIDTEPDDGSYTRDSIAVGTPTVVANGVEIRAEFGEAQFDVTNTSGEVDAFGIVVDVDGVATLVGTGELNDAYDLGIYSGSWSIPVGATEVSMY